MKIGLIHATTTALRPIEEAFWEIAPEAELLHFMDTGLLSLMQADGTLTPRIMRRFARLVDLAAASEVDCIQLTCSAFNNITDILQPMHIAKLFRSDEAMLDEALKYERIGLIATVNETPPALIDYLRRKKPEVQVQSRANPEAIELLFRGKEEEHDLRIHQMVKELQAEVDVVVLSQYSMAHVAKQLKLSIPVLTAPHMTAARCLDYLCHQA
jgi:hypothetical protein